MNNDYPVGTRVRVMIEGVIEEKTMREYDSCNRIRTGGQHKIGFDHYFYSGDSSITVEKIVPDVSPGDIFRTDSGKVYVARKPAHGILLCPINGPGTLSVGDFFTRHPDAVKIFNV
jgi:hypothetical protein